MTSKPRNAATRALLFLTSFGLAACDTTGGFSASGDQVFAPGVDLRAEARNQGDDQIEIAHRLVTNGQYELAIRAFNRAALARGKLDAEILSGLGTANLGLGRLNQSEILLRRAIEAEDAEPVDFNNLAVVLMERGKTEEAVQYFKRAFALSNGDSIEIRDNLRLALAKSEKSATTDTQDQKDYQLVRRGRSQFVLKPSL